MQPPGSPRATRKNYPVHSAVFRKDPSIERNLRRMEGRPEAETASNIISFLACRGTDIQALRAFAEAISEITPRGQTARALNILKRAVVKDRQAAVRLPVIFLRNPLLLRAKTNSLLTLARMEPFIAFSEITDFLRPEDADTLAAAYKTAVSMFPRPDTRELFFAVLNEKMHQAEKPAEKMRIASVWAENLVSLLNRQHR
ncbi:MAG TPA: hypothetical protein ENN79_13560, partial [Desulfobacteraceae bacterium]|nr:hypothetical protein [Desulfobacteraceae bacterium]